MVSTKIHGLIGLVTAIQGVAFAQQFPGSVYPYELLGLSSKCFGAVNTTISTCPDGLREHAGLTSSSMNILNADQLSALCKAECKTSLNNIRNSIKGSCTTAQDIMVYANIAYPATWLVDRMLYAYDLSCRKDKGTGQYCDTLVAPSSSLQMAPFSNSSRMAVPSNSSQMAVSALDCSDCALGIMQYQLGSPFGFDPVYASEFASTTSSCNAPTYTYATPTQYSLNGTSPTTTPTTTPTACASSYVIKQGDNCTSVSEALGVSTDNLITSNGIDRNCTMMPAVGQSLCIPQKCKTYRLRSEDNCESVTKEFNITTAQLLAWNPNFNTGCLNIRQWLGWSICVSSPSGTVVVLPGGNSTNTPAPVPPDAKSDSNKNCGQWYRVQTGDDCSIMSVRFNILFNDLRFLNPSIDQNCYNLWLNTSYCVRAVGDITAYPGYPITTAGTTFTRPPSTTTTPAWAIPTLKPRASGTINGCYEYKDTPTYDNSLDQLNGTATPEEIRKCAYALSNNITVVDLVAWNPSLSATDCKFQPGYSYCVQKDVPIVINDKNCATPDTNLIVSGTISSCTCYMEFARGDFDESDEGCQEVLYVGKLTLEQLRQWNPWVQSGSNCAANIAVNLNARDRRQICIATAKQGTTIATTATSASTSRSSSMSMTTSQPISSSSTMTTSSTPAPTQSGLAPGCKKLYTAKTGDDCSTVQGLFGITMAQFMAWNPAVDSKCNGFWAGYAYCVQGPDTTSTITGTRTTTPTMSATRTTSAGGPPASTQSGVASNCNKWYVVKSGDGCYDIAAANGITLDQFYSWNPAIGSNCGNLWANYAVCVGIR